MKYHPSLAYQGCPTTAGKYTHLPDYYQQFADELNRMKSIREEKRRKDNDERWNNFFNNFDPFGDFGEREMPCSYEEIDPEDAEDYPFSIFRLKKSASEEDMKKAYRKGILESHPDKNDEDTSDEFRVIQEAYEYYTTHLC